MGISNIGCKGAEKIPSSNPVLSLSSLEETGSSRRVRLAHLCALLQDKYKHLCRQERAATRQKRHRYAFRKALLHAAAKDPDCTAELIQALCKISRSSSR